MLVQTDEVICALQLVLATEADTTDWCHKDDGLPHTLEHLIFLGSDLFPYKGVLDRLANRSMAQGTNAWTSTDHTCYTLDTAGQEGCLNMIPIYADHIFAPTLSDSSFVTEVHHVTSDGDDKGVVYCEMQARESGMSDVMDRQSLDLLYPGCAYSSETGGKCVNLRTLTNEQVRRYHNENYRPENALLLVTGNVDEAAFLRAVQQADDHLAATAERRAALPTHAPWTGTVPPMVATAGVDSPCQIEFASDDESVGTVLLGWRACAYVDVAGRTRLELLWKYLTEGVVAPLNKALVECDEPLCGYVGHSSEIFSRGYCQLWCEDADVETIDDVAQAVMDEIRKAAGNFDPERMRSIIGRTRRQLLEEYERAPSETIGDKILQAFLYGPSEGLLTSAGARRASDHLRSQLDAIEQYAAAEAVGAAEWIELMHSAILDQTCAVVIGRPSAALAEKNSADEEARVEAQVAALGEGGLRARGKALDEAMAFNERKIPKTMLTAVPIPSIAAVRQMPIATLRIAADGRYAPAAALDDSVPLATVNDVVESLNASRAVMGGDPIWVDWCHYTSALINVGVALDTGGVRDAWRPRLAILTELIWSLPATLDGGAELDKDTFVDQLRDETVKYSERLGLPGGHAPQLLYLYVQCEAGVDGSGFAQCLKHLRRALRLTKITIDEVSIAVKKMLAQLPEHKRDGHTVACAIRNEIELDASRSSSAATGVLRRHHCLMQAKGALDAGGDAAATFVAELCALREQICAPENNLQVFVGGDLAALSHSRPDAYAELAASLLPPRSTTLPPKMPPIQHKAKLAANVATHGLASAARVGQAVVASLASLESSFALVSAPGLEPYHDDLPALKIIVNVLTVLEGPFWVKVRGAGLAYGCDMSLSSDEQRITLELYKSVDPINAYVAAKQIVTDLASGAVQVDAAELESAKAALAYSLTAEGCNKLKAAKAAWAGQYVGARADYNRWLLEQIEAVTVEQALHALKRYIVPVFDGATSTFTVCTTSAKLTAVAEAIAAERGGDVLSLEGEEALLKWVAPPRPEGGGAGAPAATSKVTKSSSKPFSFASKFKCECPKCVRPTK